MNLKCFAQGNLRYRAETKYPLPLPPITHSGRDINRTKTSVGNPPHVYELGGLVQAFQ